jgi:hypothetical protein
MSTAADKQATADRIAAALAPRVAALLLPHLRAALEPPALPPTPTPRLLDAAELAEALGTTRGYVYDHADRLGAVRLGDGPRARLRFDLDRAQAAMMTRSGQTNGS